MTIKPIDEQSTYIKEGIQYFWEKWGSDTNYDFYRDCIEHSLSDDVVLPKFYLVLEDDKIIGSYALLTNDIISRQDLMPWFACLYVEETHRNHGIGGEILQHALQEGHRKGYENLYLSTDLEGFYEKKGWAIFGTGYNVFGDSFKIYAKATHP